MTDEAQTENHDTVETVVETKSEQTAKEPKIRDPQDYNLELRRENAKLRKTLEELSASKAEELANQKLEALRHDVESKAKQEAESLLEQRLAKMEQDTRNRLMKAELKAAAERAGVVDWEDLYAILSKSELKSVEFNDDGEVTNAAEIIGQLKERKSHLFKTVTTASSAKVPSTKMETPKEKSALTMSKDEYAKAKARLAQM